MKPWPFDDPYPAQLMWLTTDVTIRSGESMNLMDFDVLRTHPLLQTAVSRLRSGHNHLEVLVTNLAEALASPEHQACMRADFDADHGAHVFRIADVPELSELADDVANAVFDISGNYRAALDKMAWRLVLSAHNGVAPDPPGVKFPICDGSLEWIKAGRARNQFDSAHCGFIEAVQPYHGVNGLADSWHGSYVHPLTMLQSVNNEGKHRDDWPVVLPGARAFISRNSLPADFDEYLAMVTSGQPAPEPLVQGTVGRPMQSGNPVIRLRLHSGVEDHIRDAGRLVPIVAFSEGRHIVETLRRIERYVQHVLSEFYRTFPPST